MFTRQALKSHIAAFISALKQHGYSPERVILFGSYAAGSPNKLSDIDLAIWDQKFTGCGSADIEPIKHLLTQYHPIELHTFSTDDDETPFVREILKSGRNVDLQ